MVFQQLKNLPMLMPPSHNKDRLHLFVISYSSYFQFYSLTVVRSIGVKGRLDDVDLKPYDYLMTS